MPELVHSSYHKCLTVFFGRVMRSALNGFGGYRHFHSDLSQFESERSRYRVTSVNNHALDLGGLGDYRVSRFVRDPRDLIVSGYFYHRRAAEPWCEVVDPTDADWTVVNGAAPRAIAPGESYAACLQRLDQEQGLLAEMEFRAKHFESMRGWPTSDPNVRVWRYEDVLGDERRVMGEVCKHYGLLFPVRMRVRQRATRFDATHAAAAKDSHVRNPSSGQWKKVFSPRVEEAFMRTWGDLLPLLGYQ
jgi:hypothetical protein